MSVSGRSKQRSELPLHSSSRRLLITDSNLRNSSVSVTQVLSACLRPRVRPHVMSVRAMVRGENSKPVRVDKSRIHRNNRSSRANAETAYVSSSIVSGGDVEWTNPIECPLRSRTFRSEPFSTSLRSGCPNSRDDTCSVAMLDMEGQKRRWCPMCLCLCQCTAHVGLCSTRHQ